MAYATFRLCVGAVLSVVSAAHASAQPSVIFDIAPVEDRELAHVVGTGGPFQQLSWRQFTTISETQARADFRALGTLSRTQMDVWWGTTGSELIAQSVRTAP